MTPPTINRRAFISSLSAFLVLVGCKKSDPKPSTTIPTTNGTTPHVIPPTVYDLELYGATELGPAIATLPGYFSLLTYGYSDKTSYYPGDDVILYLTGPKSESKLIILTDIAGKQVYSFSTSIERQSINNTKPWKNGFLFNKTTTFTLPVNLKSGVYKILTGNNVHEKIIIICKSKIKNTDLTVVYPMNTDNAYNICGGKSLYGPTHSDRSTVVSFERYFQFPTDYTTGFTKWANMQSYSINYIVDTDLEDYNVIANSKTLIIIGHSEYWTRKARINADMFVASGKNMLVLSGNTMWWQVRYAQNKTLMICTKDAAYDPIGNSVYSTIHWSDDILKYPITQSIGADWNGGGYANQLPNRWNGFKVTNASSPLFEGLNLKNGDIIKLPSYEVDGAPVVKTILPGSSEIPVIDNKVLQFNKVELLAFDFATGGPQKNGLATFIVFKKTASSGTVVNVATMNWCSPTGMGGDDANKICQITKNMIDKSLSDATLFTS
ncbi:MULTISPECIES: N,N-dimethylformamidase beta subunit family domain-containing protein [unclassified Mucilaginibacter]|uniref:N,N-dimethylformamidase beta subunit family domain-containing protein n=1 Tax=unclassified Mucilaginibacter TaxID=2617802 RepID=UPI002AC9433A|nr:MULTISPECIES: N,N-dimethylformamidase beta subunit family domain-containing protein [unclassified Mucilaginibacter]MEB0261762.1 hypothetical protein [Mucilaginibacter sp. 10I4]MEB0277568.1 hypothetical protein [Mucilaginibacter sp. 10B2]MEB0299483.1 hypothetical protein [Mucilaginibacter sp. 5C4]WPX24803.1 hypothetical protein RHM67_05930 [Mucilaginibacter sp. 5C4]